jgi:large subunit ribosomal protein L22
MPASSAKLANYRVSTRRARLLADQIRGQQVEQALAMLELSPRRFAKPLAKLVRSAIANAEVRNEREKAGIDVDNLVIGKITVDEGPRLWRIRPRAQGRANWIQKRTSHVHLELEER